MRVLELFKGTGGASKYCEANGIECISLDWDKKFNPDICCDIMEFDFQQYDKGYFDVIWASPECKIFSALQYSWIGRKWKDKEEVETERRKHHKFMERTLEIIEYLEPKYYFVENPRYSKIWDIEIEY